MVQVRVGTAFVPDCVPRKPKFVDPPAGTEPFQAAGFTVMLDPDAVNVPFQSWVMVWPLAKVHFTVHPFRAVDPALTTTSAWKPPPQEFTIE